MEVLWRTYYPRIAVYVRTSFPSLRGEAGDLSQETFAHAFAALDAIAKDAPPAPWLYAIARNLCVDRLRRQRNEPKTELGSAEIESIEYSGEGALERIEHERVRSEVAGAVETLQPRDREICYLYYFEELTVAGIAELIGRPAGTVKYRLYRIRALLKKHLEASHAR